MKGSKLWTQSHFLWNKKTFSKLSFTCWFYQVLKIEGPDPLKHNTALYMVPFVYLYIHLFSCEENRFSFCLASFLSQREMDTCLSCACLCTNLVTYLPVHLHRRIPAYPASVSVPAWLYTWLSICTCDGVPACPAPVSILDCLSAYLMVYLPVLLLSLYLLGYIYACPSAHQATCLPCACLCPCLAVYSPVFLHIWWNTCLSCAYIQACPSPDDRKYLQLFLGLFYSEQYRTFTIFSTVHCKYPPPPWLCNLCNARCK